MTEPLALPKTLPLNCQGKSSIAWWGLWTLIATEASLFGYLLLSYFYILFQTTGSWPPQGRQALFMPSLNTALLLSSSLFVWLSERRLRQRKFRSAQMHMALAILLGVAFVAIQWKEWGSKSYRLSTDIYGSLFFTITGFHMAHVVVGLFILVLLTVWIGLGYINERRYTPVSIGGMYWHFVDAVWLFVFSSLYLLPYLQGR